MPRAVLHVTDSTAVGGAENALLTLMGALDRTRWQPTLVHPHTAPAPLVEEATRLRVPRLAVPAMPDGLEGLRRLPRFAAAVRRLRPDVVHLHLTWQLGCRYPLLGSLVTGRPVVATVQLFVDVEPGGRLALERRLLAPAVARHIAVSEHVRSRIEALGWPRAKIEVIRNAIDVDAFRRPPDPGARGHLLGGEHATLVLVPGRLDSQKGHRHLLQAATEVPEAVFALAGDGPLREDLTAMAANLGVADRVRFLGYRGDVADLLAACDLVVLPSLYEGLPLTVLEAMAASRPLIATDIPGTDEVVVHDENGLLVPPADPGALASAIRGLAGDPERARRIADAGRVTVEREHRASVAAERVMRVYDDVIGH
jgi:glycosyltransferase involved in cell wall biosynthesis